mmetsp:Transcript_70397/g.129008  ORF Transcript_70397/g.129008 Transcript_70397/m.129008 type:complete len:218 (+) Transcript_70397:667-1320(+)
MSSSFSKHAAWLSSQRNLNSFSFGPSSLASISTTSLYLSFAIAQRCCLKSSAPIAFLFSAASTFSAEDKFSSFLAGAKRVSMVSVKITFSHLTLLMSSPSCFSLHCCGTEHLNSARSPLFIFLAAHSSGSQTEPSPSTKPMRVPTKPGSGEEPSVAVSTRSVTWLSVGLESDPTPFESSFFTTDPSARSDTSSTRKTRCKIMSKLPPLKRLSLGMQS